MTQQTEESGQAGPIAPQSVKPVEVKEKGPQPRISEDTLNLFRILIGLALLFPIAQLYFSVPQVISMWVSDQFVPLVNAIYFILVIIGGIWLIRYTFRFSEEERKRLKEQ